MEVKLCYSILFFTLIIHYVKGELFTAMTDMEKLGTIEELIVKNIRNYIKTQEDTIGFLKKQITKFEQKHNEARPDTVKYLANPINAFLLIKRLTADWEDIELALKKNTSHEVLQNITKTNIEFPTAVDLSGSAIALNRLKETYNLKIEDMAKGLINGKKYGPELSAKDCFILGIQSQEHHFNGSAIDWFKESIKRLKKNSKSESEIDYRYNVLNHLSIAYYDIGDIPSAIKITKEMLEVHPYNEEIEENLYIFEDLLKKNAKKEKPKIKPVKKMKKNETNPLINDNYQMDRYQKLCRKAIKTTKVQAAHLRSKYVTNNSPFLKIAPLKMEEASLDPYIVIYHDVLSESEIELIKKMAEPRLKRATVEIFNKTVKHEVANYRISKSAWIKTQEDRIFKNIDRRIEDMTSHSVVSAEPLQVVNYGIGGHYDAHFDFALKDDKTYDERIGNRIATLMFYLTDVAEGGATVFPLIDVAVWPKKGTAVFWMNLYVTGDGDLRTKHAACPVLVGNKWVANKWLHEAGQELVNQYTDDDYYGPIVEENY